LSSADPCMHPRLAVALTADGMPTKTGKSDRWTHQAVARILKRLLTGQLPPLPSPATTDR